MQKSKRLFTLLIILCGVVALAFLLVSSRAQANIFENFFKNFITPPSGSETAETPAVELYKPALEYERAVIAATKRASPSVVSITVSKNVPIIERCPYNPFGDLPPEIRQFFGDAPELYAPCERGTELQRIASGSGFIVSQNGLILTNKHVVSDAKASYTVFTNDGKKYEAQVLARDPVQDLAILQIHATGLPTVALGDSDALELGQTVIAIGNALGEFRNTVSVGVVSGLARDVTASGGGEVESIEGVVQTDAAINPGNSGGPLLNLRGEVIGINTAVVSGAQNIGFAIPINKAKRDIESVKRDGEIRIAFLGVRYVVVTPEIAEEEKLPVTYGALLRGARDNAAIEHDSPASRAGLKEGDIILEINGKRIDEKNTLAQTISDLNVGQTISIKINRGGTTLTLQATLANRTD